ncbi:MAG: thiamine ABC transporter substrate-binding protein [Candidatus Cloacimonetes bacterium]|nr:thiamine ABC transporter substrate-binding protein [Candidatus Cloacimonadota bacterium]
MIRHLRFLIVITLLIMLGACGKKDSPKPAGQTDTPQLPASELNVWAPKHIRLRGFEDAVFKEFKDKYNCTVKLRIFEDIPSLLDTLQIEGKSSHVDVVMGLDNAFTWLDSSRSLFAPIEGFSRFNLSRDLIPDAQKRLVPYGYANLCLVYNTEVFAKAPESFGELQDARYFRQLGICSAQHNGEGRGTLFWTRALFGDSGYEMLWKSIRKNIRDVYSSYDEAVSALQAGKVGMIIGYNSTAYWLQETQQLQTSYNHSLFKEGSWQYSESAAIPIAATHPLMAENFINYLLDTQAQTMVIYKLGLFPANSKTPLPFDFARIPISSFVVNTRLSENLVEENLPEWLQFWEDITNPSVIFYD